MKAKIIAMLGSALIHLLAIIIAQAQTVTQYTTYHGLISNFVFSIYEDNEFNYWFGTNEGLGLWVSRTNEWQKLTPANSSLVNSNINAILQDAYGYLWFGTDNGISVMRNDRWESYTHSQMPAFIRSERITVLFLDSRYHIWVGTEDGGVTKCVRNRLGDLEWIPYDTGNSAIISDEISAINEDTLGNIWIGSFDSGICRYDGRGQWIGFSELSGVIGNKIHVIFKDQTGALWMGSNVGLFKNEDGLNWELVAPLPNVISIAEDRDGNLWVGTQSDGVYKYDRSSCNKLNINGMANNQAIWCMIRDHEGYLWLGTDGAGAFRLQLNWQMFNTSNSALVDHSITDIVEVDSVLWFATAHHGLARYDGTAFESVTIADPNPVANFVHALLVDQNNSNWIWCATEHGVHRFDRISRSWTSWIDSLPSNYVYDIIQDRNGRCWFATRLGICCFDGTTWKTIGPSQGIPDSIITTICEDYQGHLWLGTAHAGVCELADDTVIAVYDRSSGLCHNQVNSIVQDNHNMLWFATDTGLTRFDGDQWDCFTVENSALVNNHVQSLFVDRANNIWIGTQKGGLNKFDGRLWVDYSNQVGGNAVNAIFQDSKGNFWFGTKNGLLRFIPDKSRPQVYIVIAPSEIIGVGSAMFYFLGRDIETPPEKLLYCWQLKHASSEVTDIWSDYSAQNFCELQFPTNGRYVFSVKCRDETGNESLPDTVSFFVDTAPPQAFISYPATRDMISGQVAVIGTAFDSLSIIQDFKHYWLSYAVGIPLETLEESDWRNIIPPAQDSASHDGYFTTPVINDTLIIWDTSGLYGDYWLRLAAEDTLNHISYYFVKVKIVAAQQQVRREKGGFIAFSDRLSLYVPPGAFEQDERIYCIPLTVAIDSMPRNSPIKPSSLAYLLGPVGLILNKPATLTCYYQPDDIGNLIEPRLSLIYLDSSQADIDLERLVVRRISLPDSERPLGGTVDVEHRILRTSIKQLGIYLVVEDDRSISGTAQFIDVDCQPRIFSPHGGGFAPVTTISFELSADSPVTIKVYNLAGRLVRTLSTRQTHRAGRNSIEWDGRDFTGSICPSNLYLIIFETEKTIKTKTVVILSK